MVKYFCDICGSEVIRNPVSKRVIGETKSGIFIEIMAGFKTWNTGHICKTCFISAVVELMHRQLLHKD